MDDDHYILLPLVSTRLLHSDIMLILTLQTKLRGCTDKLSNDTTAVSFRRHPSYLLAWR